MNDLCISWNWGGDWIFPRHQIKVSSFKFNGIISVSVIFHRHHYFMKRTDVDILRFVKCSYVSEFSIQLLQNKRFYSLLWNGNKKKNFFFSFYRSKMYPIAKHFKVEIYISEKYLFGKKFFVVWRVKMIVIIYRWCWLVNHHWNSNLIRDWICYSFVLSFSVRLFDSKGNRTRNSIQFKMDAALFVPLTTMEMKLVEWKQKRNIRSITS